MESVTLGTRVLKRGMTGGDVKELQRGLTTLGYNVRYIDKEGVMQDGIDGDYGSVTAAAVRAFQTKSALSATGIFDAQTRAAFTAALAVYGTNQNLYPVSIFIPDISEYQGEIDYDAFCAGNAFCIVRARVNNKTDKLIAKHMKAFTARNFPFCVYDYIMLKSYTDAIRQAEVIHDLCSPYNPKVWYIDLENRAAGITRAQLLEYTRAYIARLRELGVEKIGLYTGDYLWRTWLHKIADEIDDAWIANYGGNTGYLSRMPTKIVGGLHQYTSMGNAKVKGVKVKGAPGVSRRIDMNRLTGEKPLSWYTGRQYDSPDYFGVAKIKTATAIVRVGASDTSDKLGTVSNGALFPRREGDTDGWRAIRYKDQDGFVPVKSVKLLEG